MTPRARIRLALVDAHGFIGTAARTLGISEGAVAWYVRRAGLSALLDEWRRATGWTAGRPRLAETRKRMAQRRFYARHGKKVEAR